MVKSFTNLVERAGWTFAQSFLAVATAANLNWVSVSVLRTAGIAGGAAVLSLLKTVSIENAPKPQ